MLTKKQAHEAWIADLARSGLTLKDVEPMGWTLWEPAKMEVTFELRHPVWGYCIPYPQSFRGNAPKVFRCRVLSQPDLPFGAKPEKPGPKYLQAHGTPPAAFIPPFADVKAALAGDGRILLVEGEKKALKACKSGLVTIGLGGVWSWRAKKRGISFLPELEAIAWKGRPVYICFDSDAGTNAEVSRAIHALASELIDRGATVYEGTVPEIRAGEKAGLDDYLVAKGAAAFEEFLVSCPKGELVQRLWEFNARYAWIQHPSYVVDEGLVDDKGRPKVATFPALEHFKTTVCNQRAMEVSQNAKGEEVSKPVKVVDKWLEWPCRRTFDLEVYEPGQPRELNHCGRRYNIWPGLGVEPRKGDVTPWRKLLDHIFKESDRETRLWFERWCAWPLKHLGFKMSSAVGLWGKPGRGKSSIAEQILGPIYGTNYVSIPQVTLESSFNDWAHGKQFVLVDEVSATDSRARADVFKKYVTQKEIQINRKFVSAYDVVDHINYFMTSNSPRAFYVEDGDRRFFIHKVPDEQLPVSFFNDLLDRWAKGDGLPALLYYFQHTLDFGDFDPLRPPPVTGDKEDMIDVSRHPVEDWLTHFVGSEMFRSRGGREVYELGELCGLASCVHGGRLSPNTFGSHVAAVGMLKKKVWRNGGALRLVAVHMQEKWLERGPKKWLAELTRGTAEGGKF